MNNLNNLKAALQAQAAKAQAAEAEYSAAIKAYDQFIGEVSKISERAPLAAQRFMELEKLELQDQHKAGLDFQAIIALLQRAIVNKSQVRASGDLIAAEIKLATAKTKNNRLNAAKTMRPIVREIKELCRKARVSFNSEEVKTALYKEYEKIFLGLGGKVFINEETLEANKRAMEKSKALRQEEIALANALHKAGFSRLTVYRKSGRRLKGVNLLSKALEEFKAGKGIGNIPKKNEYVFTIGDSESFKKLRKLFS